MARKSSGILLYRKSEKLEVFLVHPGGPFFKKKDHGAWSIPKGEISEREDPLKAAKREFEEETGFHLTGHFLALAPVRQKGGKIVYAWAIEGDLEADEIVSNTFSLQWPPGSKIIQAFPEIDKAGWFDIDTARYKINEKQTAFLEELTAVILP